MMPYFSNEIKNTLYTGQRYLKDIISHVVWLYHRFTLSFRDIEDILTYRGIQVSYKSIRQWCLKFGKIYAKKLRNQHGKKSDCCFLDEVFIIIHGKMHYFCRAVDQYGDIIDILLLKSKDKKKGCTTVIQETTEGSGKSTIQSV